MPWIELLAWVAGFVVEEQDSTRSMGGFLYVWSFEELCLPRWGGSMLERNMGPTMAGFAWVENPCQMCRWAHDCVQLQCLASNHPARKGRRSYLYLQAG